MGPLLCRFYKNMISDERMLTSYLGCPPVSISPTSGLELASRGATVDEMASVAGLITELLVVGEQPGELIT